jgi:hypothetical protein
MIKVYVAAPWKHRLAARSAAAELTAAGFDVISRWHEAGGLWDESDSTSAGSNPDVSQREAEMDFFDVFRSDAMLVLNIEKSEGKAVEQGLAHALDMPIFVVGTERFNVFQWRANVKLFDSLHAAMYAMNALPK